ncbi:hypothetical protein DL768_007585 [Monosporascus sp. mg162]|nr:hypothetical protein DL768_007585 [Monosporascus sp. mg162]
MSTPNVLGLVVDKVDKSDLVWVKQQGYTKWRELPTELVKLPVDDLSTVAVLSWRWDTDEEDHVSRNILSAILQAKRMGVRHLFIDVVSIDQRLTGDELLNQVVEFSMLYRRIPVIAAYDKIGADFGSIMRRPWISNEIQAYRSNPTKIVYVSHNGQGAGLEGPDLLWYWSSTPPRKLPADVSKFRFSGFAERIWTIKEIGKTNRLCIYDVLLNGTAVAKWGLWHDLYFDLPFTTSLESTENAERAICTALSMTDFEYEAYLERKGNWQVNDQISVSLPEIEVVSISLTPGNEQPSSDQATTSLPTQDNAPSMSRNGSASPIPGSANAIQSRATAAVSTAVPAKQKTLKERIWESLY